MIRGRVGVVTMASWQIVKCFLWVAQESVGVKAGVLQGTAVSGLSCHRSVSVSLRYYHVSIRYAQWGKNLREYFTYCHFDLLLFLNYTRLSGRSIKLQLGFTKIHNQHSIRLDPSQTIKEGETDDLLWRSVNRCIRIVYEWPCGL